MEKKDDLGGNPNFDIIFYADGKRIHQAIAVTSSMPFNFDIDVAGANKLTIKIKTNTIYSYVALTDLALYK